MISADEFRQRARELRRLSAIDQMAFRIAERVMTPGFIDDSLRLASDLRSLHGIEYIIRAALTKESADG